MAMIVKAASYSLFGAAITKVRARNAQKLFAYTQEESFPLIEKWASTVVVHD